MSPWRPTIDTIRHYSWRKLRRDLVAGLTVSVVELPQSMAYALVAGVPPQYGIYTSVLQGVVGALLSSSEHLTTGPTNTQALLVASAVTRISGSEDPGRYLQLVFALTVLKGLLQLAFAAARMGTLVRFISRGVIVGVAAGAGVLIIAGQLPHALGLPAPAQASHLPGVSGRVADLLASAGPANGRAVAFALATVAVVVAARAVSKFFPGAFVAVVASAAVVIAMGWTAADLPLVGHLPRGLPAFHVPQVTLGDAEALFGGALALAVIGMLESVAIAKAIAAHTGEKIDPNQEFLAQGLKNTFTGFFQCIPGSGSFTRSALDHAAGAETRFAAVFNALLVGALFWLLAGPASRIPLAALAGVLVVIAFSLVDWRYALRVARADRGEATVCLATFLATALLPLEYAILAGTFLSLALYLRKSAHLHLAELRQAGHNRFVERPLTDRSGRGSVLFLQLEGDLYFAIADELGDAFTAIVRSPVRVVILRLKRTHSADATVLEAIERFVASMHEHGRHVLLAGVRPELLRTLRAFGLVRLVGEENVFEAGEGVFASARRALARARTLIGASIDAAGLDEEDDPEPAYQI